MKMSFFYVELQREEGGGLQQAEEIEQKIAANLNYY